MRKFLVGAALALGLAAPGAQAAGVTLEDVTVDAVIGSGASIEFDVDLSGPTDLLQGIGQVPASYTLDTLSPLFGMILGSGLQAPAAQILFVDTVLVGGTNLLEGAVLDTNVGANDGFAEALFSTDGGTLAGGFSDYFIVTLTTTGPLVDGANTGAMTVESASLAPIPLPAGAVLLIGGLGALAVTRRRKAA